MMEDTIRDLSIKSFNKKYQYVLDFLPKSVKIDSIKSVVNVYEDGTIVDSNNPPPLGKEQKAPLFETDLMRALDDSAFNYATSPNNFVGVIMNLFNRMIEEIGKVP